MADEKVTTSPTAAFGELSYDQIRRYQFTPEQKRMAEMGKGLVNPRDVEERPDGWIPF